MPSRTAARRRSTSAVAGARMTGVADAYSTMLASAPSPDPTVTISARANVASSCVTSCSTNPGVRPPMRRAARSASRSRRPRARSRRPGRELRTVGDDRHHPRTHQWKRPDDVGDALVVGADLGQIFRLHVGQVAIELLVEHQVFAALRPDAPRVVVDHVGDDELTLSLARRDPAELDLQVDQ